MNQFKNNSNISQKENQPDLVDSHKDVEFHFPKEKRNRLIVPSIKSFEEQKLLTNMTLNLPSAGKITKDSSPNKFNSTDLEKIKKPPKTKRNHSKAGNKKKY